MGFILTLVYVAFTFLSVSDTFPVLAPFRVQLVLSLLAILVSALPALTSSRYVLNLPFWLMSAFLGFTIVSWWPHGWLGGAIYVLQKFLPAAVLFYLGAINLRALPRLRALRIVLIVITIFMLYKGIHEYFTVSEESPYVMFQRLEFYEEGLRRLRGLGVLGDPNAYAQYLLSIVPMLFVSAKKKLGMQWLIILPLLSLLVYGIFLSRSRGALLALVVLVGLLVRERMKAVAAGVASAVLLVSLLALNFAGGRAVSVSGGMDRLDLWSDGLGMFLRSPIWGGGYSSYPDNFRMTAHNSFILGASELGLVGYFFWMGLLVTVIWQLQMVVAEPSFVTPERIELKRWAKAVLYALYVFLLTGFFLSQTYDALLYLLLGMGSAIASYASELTGRTDFLPKKNWIVWTVGLCLGSIFLIYIMVRLRAV
jgi:O-antigen ligase